MAKQQLGLGHVGNVKLGSEMLCFGVGHGRHVCHVPLGSEDGTIRLPTGEIVPAPGLFGHGSWRVAPEGTCEPPHCPRNKPSLGGPRTTCSDGMPSRCMSPIITHGDRDKTQERSCSSSAEVALLGGLMTHAIRDASCIPLSSLHLEGICKSSISQRRVVSCEVLLHPSSRVRRAGIDAS